MRGCECVEGVSMGKEGVSVGKVGGVCECVCERGCVGGRV